MLLWLDGMDMYGSSTGSQQVGLEYKYPGAVTSSVTRIQTGRISNFCISHETTAELSLTTPNLGNMVTVIVGFALKVGTLGACRLVNLREDDNSTTGFNLRLKADGALEVYRNTTLLATTATTPIVTGTWYFIEMKVTVNNSGSYEIRVNTNNVLSGSADTQNGATNAYANRVRFGDWLVGYPANLAIKYDDVYICDGTGSVNNDFVGPCKVETIKPTSDVVSDFTPQTGADNFAMVDDAAPNDTDYVESSTPTDKDRYGMGNLSTSGDILGIMVNAVARVTDASPFDIDLIVKSGSTEDTAASQAVTGTDYVTFTKVYEENPDTTDPWTVSEVNGLEAGFQVG